MKCSHSSLSVVLNNEDCIFSGEETCYCSRRGICGTPLSDYSAQQYAGQDEVGPLVQKRICYPNIYVSLHYVKLL